MIWLSLISLVAGALLAQRFKIALLVPATLLAVVTAAGAGLVQANSIWSTVLAIAAAGTGMQAGYFVGMLLQSRLCGLLAGRLPCSHTTSARDPSIFSRSDF
jgi:hypothetical protein